MEFPFSVNLYKAKMQSMAKITIITLQNVRNSGSALQALATQEIFRQLECDVDFINYLKNTTWGRLKLWGKNRNIIIRIIQSCLLLPSFYRENYIFKKFINEHLNQQEKQYSCIEDFKDYPITSDIYCTGSDQTWNSEWNKGILPELFLSFVPDEVKKISYAASIGKSRLDKWEIEETKRLLSRYAFISVREKSAKDIVEKQLGLPLATHVLDPTLQVDKDFWLSLIKDKKPAKYSKGKYVLIYQLNTNPRFDAYAKEFAKRKGWQLVRFCTRYDQMAKCGKPVLVPPVLDFVKLIANAGCVITDSFHATAFSCNLNIPMICIYPDEFSSRLASILTLTGLESRHLADYGDFSFVENTEIDFTHVNKALNEQRQIGWDFLRKAIAP